ncbi:glycosyltransferase family 2 protein [Haladaptatus sp. DFWS20]|uniref:glycosyltransferase family 2 protein n=1 Tax=Haladaptatus sp. DFWS20 TaxID=3403467 RepID=UPI003EBD486E
MEGGPTVSVVIPTYNRADVIGGAIDSVLNQNFNDFELLIVDDGSTDHTQTVVDDYSDPRLRYIVHQQNMGVSETRNSGIMAADGDYIAFLDSDDRWKPRKLQRQIAALERKSEEWIAAYCGFSYNKQSPMQRLKYYVFDHLFHTSSKKSGGADLIREILMLNLRIGPGSTLIVKRNAITEVDGFDHQLDIHEDWDLIIRLLRYGKLEYVEEDLVVIHESNDPSPIDMRDAKQQFLSKHSGAIAELEDKNHDVTNLHQFHLGGCYIREGEFTNGHHYIDPSMIRKPKHFLQLIYWMFIGVKMRFSDYMDF